MTLGLICAWTWYQYNEDSKPELCCFCLNLKSWHLKGFLEHFSKIFTKLLRWFGPILTHFFKMTGLHLVALGIPWEGWKITVSLFIGRSANSLTASMLYFTVQTSFTETERMGTSASSLPVVELVFHSPKDLLVAMPMWSIDVNWSPSLWAIGDTLHLPQFLFIYSWLFVLSTITSLIGSVLKNCTSTTTFIGTSLPCEGDCFVGVSAGHSLCKCQVVSMSFFRQHWHVWSMSFFHFLIWCPNRPWPVKALANRGIFPGIFLGIFLGISLH